MKVEPYEREVINLLCSDIVSSVLLQEVINFPESIECEFTGEGYYLDLVHKGLPNERVVCDKPNIIGRCQDQEIGFIVFIENGVLCLECYNYSNKIVPESLRYGTVEITTT